MVGLDNGASLLLGSADNPRRQAAAATAKLVCRRSFFCTGLRATVAAVDVTLRKVGRKPGRAVTGRLVKPPRAGSVLVIEFSDGMHEYVTTPIKRVLEIAGHNVVYIQTANSRYRMEVCSEDGEREGAEGAG